MAGMRAAGMSFFVVMVRAVDIRVKDELAGQIVCSNSICFAGNATKHLNARLRQSSLRAGANAAAENDIRTMLNQKADQCAVALTIGGNHLTAHDLTVFCIVDLELCRVSKVLDGNTVWLRYTV